jgi:serpin B
MTPISRRTLLALAAVPVGAAIIAACGDGDSTSDTTTTGPARTDDTDDTAATPPTTATGSPAPETALGVASRRPAAPDEATPAAATINALGADLYGRLADTAEANLVFSPASVAVALSMALAGARQQTLVEMAAVLHLTDPVAIHPAMNALTAALEARTGTFTDLNGDPADVVLSVANSLWGQRDLTFEPAFLDTLSGEYGAPMYLVDYRADTEGARRSINTWVDAETRRRIPELIAPGVLDDLTRLVLVNAIYLKAQWSMPFDESVTEDAPFTTIDGTEVQVPMMGMGERFPYASGAGWQAVELTYVGDELAMLLLLPAAGALGEIEAAVTSGLLDEVAAGLVDQRVIVDLPRFDIGTSTELATVLAALGMPTAFVDGVADFGGITTDEALYISAVVHAANITVDESGTEAAAATAVAMAGATATPEQPVEIRFDRPFLFAVRDRTTGAIAFMGRVGDPSRGRS